MRKPRRSVAIAGAVILPVLLGTGPAAADPSAAVYGFAQIGVGFLEIGHFELGGFLTPHVSVEAMMSWNGVFGPHYGGGATYAFGTTTADRPPRHALLVGARLMLNQRLSFDSGGDDLASYVMIPVGYAYLGEVFYLRTTLGAMIIPAKASRPHVGPSTNVAVGFVF